MVAVQRLQHLATDTLVKHANTDSQDKVAAKARFTILGYRRDSLAKQVARHPGPPANKLLTSFHRTTTLRSLEKASQPMWLGHGLAPPKVRPRQAQPKAMGRPRKQVSQSAFQWPQRSKMKKDAASAAKRGNGAFAPDGDQRDHKTTWPKRPPVKAADDDGTYKKGLALPCHIM
jgi:hypothetical protein